MGKAKDNNYISQGFEDRIEVSLANISRDKDDEFILVGMKYIPASFKCELCGHSPCLYAYTIKNIQTNVPMTVGSECINHFKGKMNIDLASGLKKRIKSVIRKMKRYMKGSLEAEEYKAMPKEQKRMLTLKLFMKHQTIEVLKVGTDKKAMLRKEEVLRIIEDNPWVEAEATLEEDQKEEKKERKAAKKIAKAIGKAAPVAMVATV